MEIKRISPEFSVSGQVRPEDIPAIAKAGFRTIICNRPDGESDDQPSATKLAAAARDAGLSFQYLPVTSGQISEDDVATFEKLVSAVEGPILAFCRTGNRSATLWALSKASRLAPGAVLDAVSAAGYDLSALAPEIEARHAGRHAPLRKRHHQIVIVGGGAGGIASAASLLRRRPSLDIAIIEPRDEHFYQPGWTLVGGGVFDKTQTRRPMREVIPTGATWIQQGVAGFLPESNEVVLDNGEHVSYDVLIAAPGLKLDWAAVKGLPETLGKNGVTSNYAYGLAPYTFELVQALQGGKALFTQPPMPIKCAGAPQKAMYLSCDYWMRHGRLGDIDVEFCNAGGVLFGVAAYVPALMEYVQKYGIDLSFNHNLVAIDGDAKVATFKVTEGDETREVEKPFDMIHVVPPQTAPDFIKASPLAGEGGWIDVDPGTLKHRKYANVWGLGDGTSTPNAKTAAAVRKQAPVVAENVLAHLDGREASVCYDGYGSCPLTVERGKIVLAEFAYGGKLVPSFPKWLIDGTKPSRLSWLLKERMLPWMYWRLMFRGHEPLARPQPCPKVAAE